jgi:2-polyprenyl-3-methyl-5-hydroxy-6-metoxy-1,4-benzoquinol methylase
MKKDSSTECWNEVKMKEFTIKAQNNDFRMHYIMPYTLQAMGNVMGKHILDLGCGEGGYSRALADMGAVVTAVDCSEALLDYVTDRAMKEGANIKTLRRNANELANIQDGIFDIVLCSMMLMDVEDLDGTLKEIHRVLKHNGRVFISILHPCFKPKESRWELEEDGIRVTVRDYFNPSEWTVEIQGVNTPLIYRHRTLSDYIKAFRRNNFILADMNEPIPTKEQLKHSSRIEWLCKIPMYLFMELKN